MSSERTGLLGRLLSSSLALGMTLLVAGAAQAETKLNTFSSRLPKAVIERGYIINLLQQPDAPMSFADEKTGEIGGFDVEFMAEIGRILDFPYKTDVISKFAQLLPSMQTGRADIAVTSLYDLKARQESVEMVDYLRTGLRFIALAGSKAATFTDLCGLKIVTGAGSSQPGALKEFSDKECVAKGMKPIDIYGVELPQQFVELKLGRADAGFGGLEQYNFQVTQDAGVYKTVGQPIARNNYGIMVPKGDMQTAELIRDVIDEMIKDGSYAKLLAKYGFQDSALPKASINDAFN